MDSGDTKEKWKMVAATKKIRGSEDQGDNDLCAGSGVRWALGSDQHRV